MTGVILLAHGSPDVRSGDATRELATKLAARRLGTTVRAAFLQHDDVSLARVAQDLTGEGVTSAIVVPVFLSNAFHVTQDVPQAVAEAEADAGLRLVVTDAVGPDKALLGALERALPPGPAVLATAGTSHAGAQADFERLAAEWGRRRGAPVVVAYASQAQPNVAAAIARLEEATSCVVAIGAFVLFPGVLPDRITAAAGGRTVSRPLYAATELLEVIEARVAQVTTRSGPLLRQPLPPPPQ